VTKGSGTGLSFGSQSGTGLYTPASRDRTSLVQNLTDGSWVETQPDGLRLIYKPVNVTPGTYSNSGWGYAQNLLGHGYIRPHLGAPASGPLSSQANQPAWLTLDREASYGPPPGSSYSADGMGSPLDQAAGAVPETPWLSLPLGSPCGGGGGGNAAPSGAGCTNPSASPTLPSTNGNLPGASYQVNLGTGNLVVSLGTPSAGSSDPSVKFFYNSLAAASSGTAQASEYGAGWTGLYRQRVDGAATAAWLGAIVNPANQRWTLTRDTQSRVQAIVDPLLRRTTFTYNSSGWANLTVPGWANLSVPGWASLQVDALSSVTDSGGRVTNFNVDGNGNLVRVTPPGSAPVTMVYDSGHLLTAWVNPLLDRTSFAYDGSGRVSRITSPNGQSTSFAYLTGRTRVTDPKGNLWTLTLDGSGNVRQALDPQGIVTSYSWDTLQKLLSFRDGRGYRTTYTYSSMADNSARLAGVQRPIGQWQFAYNSSTGKLGSITDPNGNRSSLTWDGSGNRSTLTNALNQQYAYKYSTLGQMTAAVDPLGHRISYVYDGNARRSAVANALNQRTSYAFNTSGQVSSVTDPLNHVSNTRFDSSDKLLSMTDANGNTTTQVYDPNGRQVASVNPLNSRWTSVYDPGGRLVAAQHSCGNTRLRSLPNRLGQGDRLEGFTSETFMVPVKRISVVEPLGCVLSTDAESLLT
jgi:YD repeat-containing protein